MKNRVLFSLGISLLLGAFSSQALDSFSISPLTGFGGADAWLAPGEGGYTFLGTGNLERGLAYGNGHVYLVSRNGGNNIRILNPTTGADLGALNNTGISGGTFAVNMLGVGGDGAIYVGNLTTQSTTSPYKVYSWATEISAPALAYSGNGGLAGSRVGDTLAVIGSGASTLLAAGYGNNPVVPGNNGYAIINPTASTATAVGFSGTPPNPGDFRLGLTFVNSSQVLGTQGSSVYLNTSFSGATGTLLGNVTIPDPAGATVDRMLGYTVLDGHPLLAVQSTGDSHVSIYDMTNPNSPVWLGSKNNTSGTLAGNLNGTGELAWGDVINNGDGSFSKYLYAMSSNQGIQAFIVTVPEPGVGSLAALGLGLLAFWRKLRK